MLHSTETAPRPATSQAWRVVVFLAIFVLGVFYVKWDPYFHKAFVAAAHHTLGASIVSGKSNAPPAPSWQAAVSYALSYGAAIWQALVVGLLVGAGIQTLVPRDWLVRVLGGASYRGPLTAGLAAVPAMMCTCCSAPLAVGLARSRASVASTLAFWLGNPVLNPATIVFIGFVLGWKWAFLRIVVGAILVFGIAPWIGRWLAPDDLPGAAEEAVAAAARPAGQQSVVSQYFAALWQLAKGLLPEYVVILLVLGAVRAWLFPAINPSVGHSIGLMLFLAAAGTLFVIPTAGEVPIIQTLSRFGLGAGPAGVLLLTLPAVSLPSLAMVGRALPARVLVALAVAVALLGLLTGFAAMALGF
ncbi:MAG: permease [Firmicutes bacterium]|nr:permease [Alicyclobacillaceae bacterium]MCL6496056.1 permease [Bacillota bacterium]